MSTSISFLFRNLKIQRSALTVTAINRRLFSSLAIRKPYPLLSKTPCKLAYIKPCKCCQLEPYTHLNPQDPDAELKGSLDSFNLPDGCPLEDDWYDRGEVAVSSDGLLHPETACKCHTGGVKGTTDRNSPQAAW